MRLVLTKYSRVKLYHEKEKKNTLTTCFSYLLVFYCITFNHINVSLSRIIDKKSQITIFKKYLMLLINFLLLVTTRNNIESTKEKTKDEDRLLLLDIKTSYMPMDIHSPLQSFQRRKRNIEKVQF